MMMFPFVIFLFIILVELGIKVTLAIYVYRNSERYNMDKVLWTVIVVFLPSLLGLILFLIIRSGSKPKTTCSWCGRYIEGEFLNCPYCGAAINNKCSQCGRKVDPDWSICPYCSNKLK